MRRNFLLYTRKGHILVVDYWKNTTDSQLDGEEFIDVKGYSGAYQVSNLGRVKKNFANGKSMIRKQRYTREGYLMVTIWKNNKSKTKKVHRLVAETFLDNPNNYPQVNHKDEDPTNNTLENLEFCTRKYNINYGNRQDRINKTRQSAIRVKNVKNGVGLVFLSTTDVAKFLDCPANTISSHIRNNFSIKNFKLEYIPKNFEIAVR